MKRFVYNQKYARLLVAMTGEVSQIDELARKIHANAGHLRIVLEQWSKEGVIEKDKPGRDYKIRLTKKGEAISIKLAELMDLDNNWKPQKESTNKTSEGKKNDGTKSRSTTSSTV